MYICIFNIHIHAHTHAHIIILSLFHYTQGVIWYKLKTSMEVQSDGKKKKNTQLENCKVH